MEPDPAQAPRVKVNKAVAARMVNLFIILSFVIDQTQRLTHWHSMNKGGTPMNIDKA
jgi:hypothetical protein